MASRQDGPSLTASTRSTRVASAGSRRVEREGESPCEGDTLVTQGDELRPRIAALDDDLAAVASVTAILTQSGFDVVPYTEATQLERASRTAPFAAYVLDWYLGSTTAAGLIDALRRSPASARAPIFLLSGNLAVGGMPTDEALARTIDRHRVQYRAKPYSGVKLAADLRQALGDRKA